MAFWSPRGEPCDCPWGSADMPFLRDARWLQRPHRDYEHDDALKEFTECLECGAVWDSADDNEWVTTEDRQ